MAHVHIGSQTESRHRSPTRIRFQPLSTATAPGSAAWLSRLPRPGAARVYAAALSGELVSPATLHEIVLFSSGFCWLVCCPGWATDRCERAVEVRKPLV